MINPNLDSLLAQTEAVMAGRPVSPPASGEPVHVGVDLGTAYTVFIVLDRNHQPVAGEYRFAEIVRDGLVVDFVGAVALVKQMKERIESRLGIPLATAASGYPPGVPLAEVQATGNVLRAAGLECSGLIDEPTAANNVLQIENGAIVDVGGGTTGIAVFKDGKVVYTADEPTGGTHFTLVVAGALNIPFEQAERIKTTPAEQPRLFPLVRPVMEKVGSIVRRHIAGHKVETLYLVGGTCAYPGMDQVIAEYTGVRTLLPGNPLFVTPLGIAMHN
jgi:ethanolamine utilization protein EutJ